MPQEVPALGGEARAEAAARVSGRGGLPQARDPVLHHGLSDLVLLHHPLDANPLQDDAHGRKDVAQLLDRHHAVDHEVLFGGTDRGEDQPWAVAQREPKLVELQGLQVLGLPRRPAHGDLLGPEERVDDGALAYVRVADEADDAFLPVLRGEPGLELLHETGAVGNIKVVAQEVAVRRDLLLLRLLLLRPLLVLAPLLRFLLLSCRPPLHGRPLHRRAALAVELAERREEDAVHAFLGKVGGPALPQLGRQEVGLVDQQEVPLPRERLHVALQVLAAVEVRVPRVQDLDQEV
mmetsp:Transcript_113762/g.244760  ORF Transcript_113762/g.244760 Transcript_113762/m.244760 type:complete len:292 (+) Transcript_113762:452-1327(+)